MTEPGNTPSWRVETRNRDTGDWEPLGTLTSLDLTPEPREDDPPKSTAMSWSMTLGRAAESAQQFRDSMRKLADECRRGTSEIRKLGQTLTRMTSAPGNYDPADDTWQTDLCAAWLCGSCPSPSYCDCVCHGGPRR